jgi:hypothetical protein
MLWKSMNHYIDDKLEEFSAWLDNLFERPENKQQAYKWLRAALEEAHRDGYAKGNKEAMRRKEGAYQAGLKRGAEILRNQDTGKFPSLVQKDLEIVANAIEKEAQL